FVVDGAGANDDHQSPIFPGQDPLDDLSCIGDGRGSDFGERLFPLQILWRNDLLDATNVDVFERTHAGFRKIVGENSGSSAKRTGLNIAICWLAVGVPAYRAWWQCSERYAREQSGG